MTTAVNPPSTDLHNTVQRYFEQAKAPLLINSCEIDAMFPREAQEKTDAILGGGRFAPGYARTYWEGCTHGFAVRGDMVRHPLEDATASVADGPEQDDPRVRAGKEGAFRATVEFLRAHL